MSTFGKDYDARKAVPVFEGVLMYFPDAVAAVAAVSKAGNDQHNPGQSLHWARGKSMDQYNTAMRHLMDHRTGGGRGPDELHENNGWKLERYDTDGVRHLAKAAWRVLAALQLDIEEEAKEKIPAKPEPAPAPASDLLSKINDKGSRYLVDEVRTDACRDGRIYCWKPMCKGHKYGKGTCRV